MKFSKPEYEFFTFWRWLTVKGETVNLLPVKMLKRAGMKVAYTIKKKVMAEQYSNEGNGKRNYSNGNINRPGAGRVVNPPSEKSLQIDRKITQLEKEWDVDRSVELNCAVMAVAGTALGALVNKRWFALPILAAAFLAQHSIQGWSPLIPVFKKFGFRNKNEINRERMALKALRGDFKRIGGDSDKAYKAVDL